jgi:hypothetical protein
MPNFEEGLKDNHIEMFSPIGDGRDSLINPDQPAMRGSSNKKVPAQVEDDEPVVEDFYNNQNCPMTPVTEEE